MSRMAPTALQVLLAALLLLSSARDVGGVVLRPDGTPDLTACSCVPTAQCILHPFLPTSDIDFQCERPGHVCCVPDSIVIGAQVCTCRTSRCTGSIAGKCPTPGEFCCSGSISPNPNQPPTPALEADCNVEGRGRGRCIVYNNCQDRLATALNNLPIPEFVALYGCGLNSDGQFQVCCPFQ